MSKATKVLCGLLLAVFTAAPAYAAKTLNAYTIMPEKYASQITQAFTDKTGIKVNFVRFASGEALARLIAGYLPEGAAAKANEPLFTKMDAFDFALLTDEEQTEQVSIVGNLCTGADSMAANIRLPRAKIGDILTISKAGSYAYVLSPVQFSSQPVPGQFLLTTDGRMEECSCAAR